MWKHGSWAKEPTDEKKRCELILFIEEMEDHLTSFRSLRAELNRKQRRELERAIRKSERQLAKLETKLQVNP